MVKHFKAIFRKSVFPWVASEGRTGQPRVGRRRAARGQRGVALAVATLAFASLLMAAGMAIDISHFYLAGTELQNAADAAALAGAAALNSTSAGITQATDNAVTSMNKFEFDQVTVTIGRSNVRFGVNLADLNGSGGLTEAQATASPTTVRFVKVTLPPKSVNVYLAKVALNTDTVNLTRTAVAGQSEAGASGDVTPNEVCNVYRYVLVEGSSASDGSLDRITSNCGSSYQYTQGCDYNVHMTPPCDSALSYYQIINSTFTGESSDLNAQMADKLPDCFWKNKDVSLNPHPSNMNIVRALNTMFGTYSNGLTSSAYPPDANVKQNITYAQYKTATSGSSNFTAPTNGTGVPGRRILVLPIMKGSDFWFDGNTDLQGTKTYRFGAFFLKAKPSGTSNNGLADLKLEYIGDRVTVGNANYNPSRALDSTTAKGLAMPVLYR
jgi:Flp pilus assembly protein TadG